MKQESSNQSEGQSLSEMKTYTHEEIFTEKAKIQNIWLKSAFYTSTIIFTVFLYSVSKIVDIGLIYKLLFRFGIYWLLPQIIGFFIALYISGFFKYYKNIYTVIIFVAQIPIIFAMGNILKSMDALNFFTILISWLYLLIEVVLYLSFIDSLKVKE